MSKDAMMGVRALEGLSARRLRRGARPDKRGVVLLALLAGLSWPAAAQADPPVLQLPIACTPGKDCFVQNYPDDDPASGTAHDFTCTSATYDGHDGTDIRMLSIDAAKGINVLAAAAGIVRGVRDGVPDHLMQTDADKAALKGRECGNGVAIVHGGGWETQYCHMRLGTLLVRQGQAVKAGDRLGQVGQSGQTQFAHVHLTVRHNGKPIDPFTGRPLKDGSSGAACAVAPGAPLWAPAVAAALGAPRTEVLEAAFSDHVPSGDVLELGHAALAPPKPASQDLILFGRIMHFRTGDRVRIRIMFPGGAPLDQTSEPSARDSATRVFAGGRKRRDASWPAGRYSGSVEVLRAGAVVATGEAVMVLGP
jgi:hypothetical protein